MQPPPERPQRPCFSDLGGVPVSCKDPEALALYAEALHRFVQYRSPAEPLARCVQIAPNFVLPLALVGITHFQSDAPSGHPQKEALKSRVSRLVKAAQSGTTVYERRLLQALLQWGSGRVGSAVALLEQLLVDWPRDMLALRLTCDAFIVLGRSRHILDVASRVYRTWKAEGTQEEASYVKGWLAFGLEESGRYYDARRIALEAIDESGRRDVWSMHTVAHVEQMQGRAFAGLQFLETTVSRWQDADLLAVHMWWHKALFEIEFGRTEAAMRLYDSKIVPSLIAKPTPFPLADATQLLWRARLATPTGTRGGAAALARRSRLLCDMWAQGGHATARGWVYTSAHCVMAAALANSYGSYPLAHRVMADAVADAEKAAESGKGASLGEGETYGQVMRNVGLPLLQGLKKYGEGDYRGAAAVLTPQLYRAWRVGGSNAQRDMFALTAVDAALRCGEVKFARALASQRVTQSPASAGDWLCYANCVAACVDERGSAPGTGCFDDTLLLRPKFSAARKHPEVVYAIGRYRMCMGGARLTVSPSAVVILLRRRPGAQPGVLTWRDVGLTRDRGKTRSSDAPRVPLLFGNSRRRSFDNRWEVLMAQREVKNWLRSGPQANETVLMRYPGEYIFPGGATDPGESPEEAARREVAEELGISVPENAKLHLVSVKQTRPIRFRSNLVYVYAAVADENPWLAALDGDSVQARFSEGRARFEKLAASGAYWKMPLKERLRVAPELHGARWMPMQEAVKNAFTSMNISLQPVNSFQKSEFARLGLTERDPMFLTLALLLDVERFKSTQELARHAADSGGPEALLGRAQWLFDGMTRKEVRRALQEMTPAARMSIQEQPESQLQSPSASGAAQYWAEGGPWLRRALQPKL
eukprot:TRINITY_DN31975_c0_g1_i1.p1 TRINITY_DN31975_c0_g1~~TRINITY_DN31975_c0_g1_i1.p1  ORF type:complete len:896 (+),score=202.48 TRINITY_DN31975_c0_g1_i1:62-2689(+)